MIPLAKAVTDLRDSNLSLLEMMGKPHKGADIP